MYIYIFFLSYYREVQTKVYIYIYIYIQIYLYIFSCIKMTELCFLFSFTVDTYISHFFFFILYSLHRYVDNRNNFSQSRLFSFFLIIFVLSFLKHRRISIYILVHDGASSLSPARSLSLPLSLSQNGTTKIRVSLCGCTVPPYERVLCLCVRVCVSSVLSVGIQATYRFIFFAPNNNPSRKSNYIYIVLVDEVSPHSLYYTRACVIFAQLQPFVPHVVVVLVVYIQERARGAR